MLNPYRSPDENQAAVSDRESSAAGRQSIIRGLVAALLLAPIGLVLPVVLVALKIYIVCFARRKSLTGTAGHRKRQDTTDGEVIRQLHANIGAMILFALTGLVHFTCKESPGFLRTMIKIGLATIIGVFLMLIATVVFELRTMSYTEDPNAPTRLAIFSSVPIFYACWLLTHGIRNQPNNRLQRSP